MKRLITPLLVSVVITSGCATSGNVFTIGEADNLVPGETTYEETVAILGVKNFYGPEAPGVGERGKPTSRRVNEDGTVTYTWIFSAATILGASVESLELLFDSDGVLIREVSRTGIY